jgi:hypothetical protein
MISIVGQVPDRPPDVGIALLPGDLRFAASVALPQPHGMPVIFCRFLRSDAGFTVFQEDLGANRNIQWLNYVLINADVLNADRGCCCTNLSNAANYSGDTGPIMFNRNLHDSDVTSVMRANPVPGVPIVMMERHAEKLRTAYFARVE